MQDGTRLCALDDIADGAAKGVEIGEKPKSIGIIVLRNGDNVRGFLNRCPHRGLPLETFPDAFLDATGEQLVCTNHGARFRATDGMCVHGPCLNIALVRMPLRVEGRRGRPCRAARCRCRTIRVGLPCGSGAPS